MGWMGNHGLQPQAIGSVELIPPSEWIPMGSPLPCPIQLTSKSTTFSGGTIYPKANLSRRHQEHRVYPYLLRGLRIHSPNQVWGTDITYIRMRTGWMDRVVV